MGAKVYFSLQYTLAMIYLYILHGMNSISIIFSLPEVEAAPKRATGGGKYEAA